MKRMLTTVVLMGTLAAMTCSLMASEPNVPGQLTPITKDQSGRLTIQQLHKMLDDLGYNPKPFADKNGKVVGYNIEFESGTWTMRFSVSLSNDGNKVWFDGGMVTLTDLAGVPPQALLSLLEQNDAIAPAYIYFYKPTSNLRMCVGFANQELTTGKLRKQVDFFADALKRVITRYQQECKPVQPTPPGPAKLPS